MNVNGIDPEVIRAQANSLLQSKQKVDLEQEDLELLWENAKLTSDSSLFDHVSDEEALAMFDKLDNKGNTAATSYKLLMNWLKSTSKNATKTEDKPSTAPAQSTTTTTTPAASTETKEPEATKPEATVVETPPQVDDGGVKEPETVDVKPETPVETQPPEENVGTTLVKTEPETAEANNNIPEDYFSNAPVVVNPVTAEPITNPVTAELTTNPADDTPEVGQSEAAPATQANTPSEDTKVQQKTLRPNGKMTLEQDGVTYEIKNNSAEDASAVLYYVKNGQFVIEGDDLTIVATSQDANNASNVHIKGNSNTISFGDGDDKVTVTGDRNTITGGGGNDNITVEGNFNSVSGNDGDDTLSVQGNLNFIYGDDGKDFAKIRGDRNTVNLGDGDDVAWMSGLNNNAMGIDGDDNFFAAGEGANFFGDEGPADASYYKDMDISKADKYQYSVEKEISGDAIKDFEDWLNKVDDDEDGPPYTKLPPGLGGHKVDAYDNNTFTDKYESASTYFIDYKTIVDRQLRVRTLQNKDELTGQVVRYDDNENEISRITIGADMSVTYEKDGNTVTIPASEVKFLENGNVVKPGGLQEILMYLATGKYTIANLE